MSFLALLSGNAVPSAEAAIIRMGSLGPGIAFDINDTGEIVGVSGGMPVHWTSKGTKSVLPGGSGQARAINSHGFIAGTAGSSAVYWDNDHEMHVLGQGNAEDINDHGQIVGHIIGGGFFWDPTEGLQILPDNFSPLALNNNGVVVGEVPEGNSQAPAIWDVMNGVRDLRTITGDATFRVFHGINDEEHIIGQVQGNIAAVWAPDHGLQIIGHLAGGDDSVTSAINSLGWVAGESLSENAQGGAEAYIWYPEDGIHGLGDLPGGEFDSESRGINRCGQVVGWSQTADGTHAFIAGTINISLLTKTLRETVSEAQDQAMLTSREAMTVIGNRTGSELLLQRVAEESVEGFRLAGTIRGLLQCLKASLRPVR